MSVDRKHSILSVVSICCCLLVFSWQSTANEFSSDFVDAYRTAESDGQKVLTNKLAREGLMSLVWHFHHQRTILKPARYEDSAWFAETYRSKFSGFRSKFLETLPKLSIDASRLKEMQTAYKKNRETFLGYFQSLQTKGFFRNYTAEEVLSILSMYSSAVYALDPKYWNYLSSLTGIWPFCLR